MLEVLKRSRRVGEVCFSPPWRWLAWRAAAPAANLTWSGGFNNRWSFIAGVPNTNWNGSLPAGGDDILSFPAGGANKAMDNDFPANTKFVQLRFPGAGYTLGGNALTLDGDLAGNDPAISVTHGAGTTSIEVEITVNNNPLPVSVTNAAATLEFHDAITSAGGSITITGLGRVVMTAGANRVITASVAVGSGTDSPTLVANSLITGTVRVRAGATLAGLGDLTDSASDQMIVDGTLSPGDPDGGSFATTRVSVAGSLTFSSTAEVVYDLVALGGGGSDGLDVSGPILSNGAIIRLLPTRGFPVGTNFTLIGSNGTGPISIGSPFRLPNLTVINEGTEVTIGVNRFRFSYAGGSGKDFTARMVAAPSSGVREWDAGGTTRLFSEAANWTGNVLPIASNTLRFGANAPNLPLAERFPVNDLGGNFFKLEFTAGGYALEEAANANDTIPDLTLSGGIEASHSSDGVTIDQDLFLGAAQTYALTGASFLRFGLNNTIDTEDFDLTVHNTSTGEMRFNGPIVDGGRLIKTGSGYVLMGGASISTYTGGTAVDQGELRLSRSSVNGAVPAGALIIGGAGMSARVTTTAAEQIADAAVVTVQTLGALEPGAAETIAALNLEGGNVGGTGVLAVAGNITAAASAVIACPTQINGSVRDWDVAASRTLQVTGALTVSPASTGITQRKTGPGILRLSGSAATTTISMTSGELQMNIPGPNTASVSLSGGVLGGTGRAHEITGTSAGGEISPGVVAATTLDSAGTLGCARLTLHANTRVALDIAGTLAGVSYDVLSVTAGTSTGVVTLNNAQLALRQTTSVPVGSLLVVVDNDGTDAVTGTFAGLPQGAIVSSPRNSYTINYAGGTGNDIVLTAITAPEIAVEFASNGLTDGGSVFTGAVVVRESSSSTFTLRNLGTGILNLSGAPRVQISGTDAAFFTVTTQPPATVAANGSTTFVVSFAPTSGGSKTAQLTIPNNDTDEGPFNLTLQATAIPSPIITASAIIPPAGGNPATVNITLTGATPNTNMRLEASTNLTTWTALRTFTTDSQGGAVTGVIADTGNTSLARRFYRAITIP